MENMPIAQWLDSLAARVPTPGGGAAAGLSAAMAAGLVEMVTIYTTGSRWADREARMLELNREACSLRQDALAQARADEDAFAAAGAAYALSKDTPDEKTTRSARIQEALLGATKPPLEIIHLSIRLIDMAAELTDTCNKNVVSDVAVASALAGAALASAKINVEINLASIKDPEQTEVLSKELSQLQNSSERVDTVVKSVSERIRS